MNRAFSASSSQVRAVLAVAAVLATLVVAGSIEGLSQHYAAETQLASAKTISGAQR